MKKAIVFLISLMFSMSFGQSLKREKIHQFADEYFVEGMFTLKEFLQLPNIGSNPDNIDLNLSWCENAFKALDFKIELLTSEGVKHLLAEKAYRKKAPTVLFYLQIDGQPVDSSKWNQKDPFDPVLKECVGDECSDIPWEKLTKNFNADWKVFARSASDSKGPAIAFLQTLKILKEKKINPGFNIKVIMDFQEELGSPTLPALVRNNRNELSADAMLIMDGTRPPNNLPTLTFGARGIATMKLTVYGAYKNLHSGQYGNYAPNPVFSLSRLLGSMKDEEGRVLIPGYYGDIELTDDQKALINSVPENEEKLLMTLGIAKREAIGETYQEALQFPSLNVRGLRAAWVENEVRTIIPSEALAEIDIRLVPETPAERQIQLLTNFIESKGFYVLGEEPSEAERRKYPKLIKIESRIGSRPFRTPLDSQLGNWLGSAMTHVFGEGNFIRMQSTGGSQPIAPFISELGTPAISVRIPNPDNNIHAPNENLRLGNFHEGLKMCLGILTQKYE
ncbi:M20/M25/M40 family metallo-hydrolase [Flagellimonas pacifica]|uniref:Acetylornithine deacetylase/Succinyl-diaminopimelate desuccinylase n=1 Tax=Flagellimonas pacifica TaxID=1247520 RepID=A0A285MCH0_9FLAO|nr:M20/M25/M40 family metallo-hydrolase [Allomuricauda parva]SNY94865.1 Acetylornithine deacetylase/Succinyl-diaminopimelate desuccinylase [Allomuricauda parva]